MSDPVATPIQGEPLRMHAVRGSNTSLIWSVVSMLGTVGGIVMGVVLTCIIAVAVFVAMTSRTTERRVDPISPRDGITEERMFELLKGERESHQRSMRELAEKYEALRSNVAQWQTYCENTRCRCRHPGTPGSPGVGAVGAAVMESAPPKVGDKP